MHWWVPQFHMHFTFNKISHDGYARHDWKKHPFITEWSQANPSWLNLLFCIWVYLETFLARSAEKEKNIRYLLWDKFWVTAQSTEPAVQKSFFGCAPRQDLRDQHWNWLKVDDLKAKFSIITSLGILYLKYFSLATKYLVSALRGSILCRTVNTGKYRSGRNQRSFGQILSRYAAERRSIVENFPANL